jgi:hypothetical protein
MLNAMALGQAFLLFTNTNAASSNWIRLMLVSFDRDFDKTDLKRKKPAMVLKKADCN